MLSEIKGLLQWVKSVQGKQQIIQNETHIQHDSTELKTKHLRISTFYTKQHETTVYKIRPTATKYIFSYVQDQNINLHVQGPMKNRKKGTLYQCLNNADSWKIHQIFGATIVGNVFEL